VQDLEDRRGCRGGVSREQKEETPFLDWIHACAAAAKAPQAVCELLDCGVQTSAMQRRNAFLKPVFDDGTGQLELQRGGRDRTAFRKGHLAVAQFMQDRPEGIMWEQPFQYAGRKVRENVTDAIEQAKLLRKLDRSLVPVASCMRRLAI
jgi:hypothetical protein